MESDDEIAKLEARSELLNEAMDNAEVEQKTEIQSTLEAIYDHLDQLDAASAEACATSILFGLGFTTTMMKMST
jgi:ATPase subunit of ABC transporter with duplicated ATPase domains